MNEKPSINDILQLIEDANLSSAVDYLDKLLSYYAQRGEIDEMVDVLVVVNQKYPKIKAIGNRLQVVLMKVDRSGFDGEAIFEA